MKKLSSSSSSKINTSQQGEQIVKIERGFLLSDCRGLGDCECGGGGGGESGQSNTNVEPTTPKSQQLSSSSSLETKTILIGRQLDCKINCKFDNHNNPNKHHHYHQLAKQEEEEENNNNKNKSENNNKQNVEQNIYQLKTKNLNINCDNFHQNKRFIAQLEHHRDQQQQQRQLIPDWVLLVLKNTLLRVRARRRLQIEQEPKVGDNLQYQKYQLAREPMDSSQLVSAANGLQQNPSHHQQQQQNVLQVEVMKNSDKIATNNEMNKKQLIPRRVKKRISKIISPMKNVNNQINYDQIDENKNRGFYFAGFGSHQTNNDANVSLQIKNNRTTRAINHHSYLQINSDNEQNNDYDKHYIDRARCNNYYWPLEKGTKTMSLCVEASEPQGQQLYPSLQRRQKHYYISTAANRQSGAASTLSWSMPRVFPNNTLIADLSSCHPNLIHQLPEFGLQATSKRLMLSLNQCWKPAKEHLQKQQVTTSQISDNRHQLEPKSTLYTQDTTSIPIDDISSTTANDNNLRLRLDLMIPKSTNSLPVSLMSQLDAESLLRLQDNGSHLNNSNNTNDEATKINEHTTKQASEMKLTKTELRSKTGIVVKRERRRPVKFEMPEALLGARVRLKREDYDKALCVLTSDFRYQLHLILYSRIQSLWLLMSTILCMFIPFVFMVPELSILIMSGALWFLLQILGGLATFAARKSLNLILERAVAQANSYFMDHNLMLGVINLGGIFAKSKLMVPLVYFDTTPCRLQIESILASSTQNELVATSYDIINNHNPNGISIISNNSITSNKCKRANDCQQQHRNNVNNLALANSQMAKKIVLKYSQRWISQYDRRKLVFSGDEDDQIEPRHLSTGKCICQFFEAQYLEAKRLKNVAPEDEHKTLNDLKDVKVELVNDSKYRSEHSNNLNNHLRQHIDLHDELKASPISELVIKQSTQNKLQQSESISSQNSSPSDSYKKHYDYQHCNLALSLRASQDSAEGKGCSGVWNEQLHQTNGKHDDNLLNRASIPCCLSDRMRKAIEQKASAPRVADQQRAPIIRPITFTTHQQELLSDPSMKQVQQMGFSQLALMSSP